MSFVKGIAYKGQDYMIVVFLRNFSIRERKI